MLGLAPLEVWVRPARAPGLARQRCPEHRGPGQVLELVVVPYGEVDSVELAEVRDDVGAVARPVARELR